MPDLEGDIELDGLTLPQYKAAVLIASGKCYTDKKIAEDLEVTVKEVCKWKKLPTFRFKVIQLFEEASSSEITSRTRKMKSILSPIYKEIKKRLENEEIANMRFDSLIAIMTRIQNEVRTDHRLIAQKFSSVSKMATGGDEDMDSGYYEGEDDEDILRSASRTYQTKREDAVRENAGKVVQMVRKG